MTIEPRTPYDVEMEHRAWQLEEGLRDGAKRLGLRIKVTYDKLVGGFCIDSAVVPFSRYTHTIDEEMMFIAEPKARVDLLIDILDDLQRRNFDDTRKKLDELDVRGRIVALSRDDKDALHEMIWLAGKGVSFHGGDVQRDREAYEKGRAVMEKLFK